jgi:broad specificity phosphatase PhoE
LPETTLVLLRHGATRANVCRPYVLQGLRPDSELIDLGITQAEAAARALRTYPIVRAYCSPLKRARLTAQIVAESLRVPFDVVPGLVEADVGEWEGLAWEEIERRWPDEHRAFREAPEHHGYLGGENLTEVRERVLLAVADLVSRHGSETFLVVGHGLVNRVLLAHWLGLPLRYARQIPQDNVGVNVVEFREGEAKVRTVNAVVHLKRFPKHAATGQLPPRAVGVLEQRAT